MEWNANAEREAILNAIHLAFDDVSRQGGISWSESEVVDAYRGPVERKAARESDKDGRWQELVDDPAWDPSPGVGGFSFLDAIGFRYYLPAAMARSIQSGFDEGIQFHLTLDSYPEYSLSQWAALNKNQCTCVAKFIRYMRVVTALGGDEFDSDGWRTAFGSYWHQF